MKKQILKKAVFLLAGILTFSSCSDGCNSGISGTAQQAEEAVLVTPAKVVLSVGETAQFQAVYQVPDGDKQNVTTDARWTIVNYAAGGQDLAKIVEPGKIEALIPGRVELKAGYHGIIGKAEITIKPRSDDGESDDDGKTDDNTDDDSTDDGKTDDNTDDDSTDDDGKTDDNTDEDHTDEDTVSPTVVSAELLSATELKVVFSEVLSAGVFVADNYKISQNVTGSCDDGSNFDSPATTLLKVNSVSDLGTGVYMLNLSSGLQPGTFTLIFNTAQLSDLAGNKLACPNTATFEGYDSVVPVVTAVSSQSSELVRVSFSEPVGAAAAEISSYKIVDGPVTSECENNANFSGASATKDFNITAVKQKGTSYILELSEPQIKDKAYVVLVDKSKIADLSAVPQYLGCPNNGDFIGREQLKVMSAVSVSPESLLVSFSKPVKGGIGSGSAECSNAADCAKIYRITGVSSLGDITSAHIADGTVCDGSSDETKVCLVHSQTQTNGQYTVTVANGRDGDGFDDRDFGAVMDAEGIENLQRAPKDRASFLGKAPAESGEDPVVAEGMILAYDPFNDGSDFAHVAVYDNKIYMGPNYRGNSATRFNPDGTNPESLTFSFIKDTTGATTTFGDSYKGTSRNTATTRDDGIAVPPYVTIGSTGCTKNSADLSGGCGPDNQDGRGLFTSGIFNGEEHLFISGARSDIQNYYIYATTDKDTQLDYTYLDMYRAYHLAQSNYMRRVHGTESILVFNQHLYWVAPGDGVNRPYVMQIINKVPEAEKDRDAKFMHLSYMDGFGKNGNPANRADKVGAIAFGFNNRLYLANSGAINDSNSCGLNSMYSAGQCQQLGGIIRSVNDDPEACGTSTSDCKDWVDISPVENIKYTSYFTDVLTKLSDLTPAEQPIPAMAEYNGNLYLIRNACVTSRWARGCIEHECVDDVPCPEGERVPQLWRCIPDKYGECQADGWELVAEHDDTGRSNMGVTNNGKITLLVANGSRLYVGFDNKDGILLYRTKEGVKVPQNEADFEQVGEQGLGDTDVTQIYSAVTLQQGAYYYLYLSMGQSGQPIRIYRHQNL